MKRKIKILVVDDSVMSRRYFTHLLSLDPHFEVVGFASNGELALRQIPLLMPDLITLDIDMPVMDGIETLRHIRRLYPTIAVIVISGLSHPQISQTLEALSLGAFDYLTKPVIPQGQLPQEESFAKQLTDRIKNVFPSDASDEQMPVSTTRPPTLPIAPVELIAIGISTGGPQALTQLFSELPADFHIPILIVQHMPPLFTKLLAERLTQESRFPVYEASAGVTIEPHAAWIAPGDHHLLVRKENSSIQLILNQNSPENGCRPSVDVLFQSVADSYGSHALGIIMTGMGSDGLKGAQAIHAAGGQIWAQDRSSSTIWGMPKSVIEAGIADRVFSLSELAQHLRSLA